jgi:transposase
MMGHRKVEQAALFYEFSLDRRVPADHLLRSIDRFVEFGELRRELAPFYSPVGRPSIDPELMIRMLIVGYCFGIRSERRLCDEVHLNLAYRWFCRLGLDGDVPDHSTFSKNRHGRFPVLRRCIREELVGGEGFAIDASLIKVVRETFGRSGPCRRAVPRTRAPRHAARIFDLFLRWSTPAGLADTSTTSTNVGSSLANRRSLLWIYRTMLSTPSTAMVTLSFLVAVSERVRLLIGALFS